MTPKKERFTSYKSSDFGVVFKGGDVHRLIVSIGDVKIKSENGVEYVLRMLDTCQRFE